jgi:hypothetical protein
MLEGLPCNCPACREAPTNKRLHWREVREPTLVTAVMAHRLNGIGNERGEAVHHAAP